MDTPVYEIGITINQKCLCFYFKNGQIHLNMKNDQ